MPDVLEHTGSEAFDAHLKGVQGLLRGWGVDETVADAGLFHSICEFFRFMALFDKYFFHIHISNATDDYGIHKNRRN